jgi:hypothetical protein
MKINDLLSELRRNPTQNVKEEGHAAAVKFLKTIPYSDIKYYGVTLTQLPKLGVNPQSKYNTPLAICFYPADYYLKKKHNNEKMEFQDSAPYIQIIEIVDDEVEIDQLSESSFTWAIEKIYKLLPNLASTFKVDAEKLGENLAEIIVDSTYSARTAQPGSRLWYILMRLSSALTNDNPDDPDDDRVIASRTSVVWNKLLRLIGYSVILDNGSGILHPAEPYQGMAFDPTSVKLVKMFYNSKKPDNHNTSWTHVWSQQLPPEKYVKFVADYISNNTYDITGNEKDAKKVGRKVFKIFKAHPELYNKYMLSKIKAFGAISQDSAISKFLRINWVAHRWNTDTGKLTINRLLNLYIKSNIIPPIDQFNSFVSQYKLYKTELMPYSSDPLAAKIFKEISEFITFVEQNTKA